MTNKELKDFEEEFNKKLQSKPLDETIVQDMLALMEGLKGSGQKIVMTPEVGEDGKVRFIARIERDHGSTKDESSLREQLEELKEEFGELEEEEPDEAEEEAYEEWEQRKDALEREIENLEEKLGLKKREEEKVVFAYETVSTGRYAEFAKIGRSVFVDGEDKKTLIEYIAQNDDIRKSILDVCNLILSMNCVSISMLQRKLKIGYNKAGSLVEVLEGLGAITPFDGVHARGIHAEQILKIKTVLMSD